VCASARQSVPVSPGLPLRVGLSHEIHRSEGRGPDMDARIAAFMNKTAKIG
jgi:hypothetical protein